MAVTAVSNVLGTINPVAEIIRRAHAAGAVVLVDAAQSVPHLPTDVPRSTPTSWPSAATRCSAPRASACSTASGELLDAMPPFLGGGSMIRRVRLDGFEPGRAARQVRSRHAADRAGDRPGRGDRLPRTRSACDAIHEHERRLDAAGPRGARSRSRACGSSARAPSTRRASSASRHWRPAHAHDIAQLLDRHGIAVRAGHHCAMPLHKRLGVAATTRASFYLYNTLEEVDKLVEAVAKRPVLPAPRAAAPSRTPPAPSTTPAQR